MTQTQTAFDALTRRSRLTLRVTAATTSDDPWVHGYTEYVGTARTLLADLAQIKRDHGGNTIMRLYHNGRPVANLPLLEIRSNLEMIND
jgi:hypothetical protein